MICCSQLETASSQLRGKDSVMAEPGFDDPGIFFSDPLGSEQAEDDESERRRTREQRRFADFIRNFVDVQHSFKYRQE